VDGLVFAAGRGSRLRPLTDDTPKPLLPVDGRPILEHCLETLADLGVDRLVVVVGYRAGQVIDHVGETFRDLPVAYARQDERLGMAHALLAAEDHLDGDVAMLDGDCLVEADLRPLVERHRDPGVDGTLLLTRVSAVAARSKAVVDRDDEGRLLGIRKEPDDPPDPALVAASVQTATPALLDACRAVRQSPRGEYEMAAAIQRLIDDGKRIVGVEADGWHANVNTPEDLAAARAYYD